MQLRNSYFFIVLLTLTALVATTATNPELVRSIAKEDHALENLTALLLAASVLIGIIVTSRPPSSLKHISLGLGTISLIGLLDEISFGQRLFKLDSVKVGNNNYIDGIHDIAEISKIHILAAYTKYPETTTIAITLIGMLSILSLFLLRSVIARALRFLAANKLLSYLVVLTLLAKLAQLIDIDIIGSYIATPLEETLETLAALGLLYSQVQIYKLTRNDTASHEP